MCKSRDEVSIGISLRFEYVILSHIQVPDHPGWPAHYYEYTRVVVSDPLL